MSKRMEAGLNIWCNFTHKLLDLFRENLDNIVISEKVCNHFSLGSKLNQRNGC